MKCHLCGANDARHTFTAAAEVFYLPEQLCLDCWVIILNKRVDLDEEVARLIAKARITRSTDA